jgi:TAT (twin-arginine translocation) pathway signal sequence
MNKMRRRDFLKTAGVAALGAGCVKAGIGKLHAQERTNSVTTQKEFQPGETARTSGVYDVFHDKIDGEHHAHQHQVIVTAGTVFPRCKGCQQWVRFRLAQEAVPIEKDPHFEA